MQGLDVEIEYTSKSVQNILEHFFHFQHSAENGNMDALILIADMKVATKKVKLTEQQKRVYYCRFLREYTVEEVAEVMCISHQAVSRLIERIVAKIVKVLNGEELR
jgi:RNA polymerase sigma factor (sigma-70 family)